MEPQNEVGGAYDAARSELPDPTMIANQLRKINSAVPSGWISEGWRLFHEWSNTGNVKHLQAFARHVAAMRARFVLAADGHCQPSMHAQQVRL